jgi:hypothetical protein
MKKLLLIALTLLLVLSVEAQKKGQMIKWLRIAPKASFGTALLINSNTFDDKNIEEAYFNMSTAFGGSLGLGIGDYLEFYAELNALNFGQTYHMQVERTEGTYESYDKTLAFTAVNTGVLMRWTTDMGGYFEIGPNFTKLKSAKVSNDALDLENPNYDDFNHSYINLSLGFGQALYRSERLFVYLGARFNFSPVSMYLPRDLYPNATYFKDGIYDIQNLSYEPNLHEVQGKTMPLMGFVTLEVNYTFGFWGNARCGRGRLMFFQ